MILNLLPWVILGLLICGFVMLNILIIQDSRRLTREYKRDKIRWAIAERKAENGEFD